jgi:minor curlin subunit
MKNTTAGLILLSMLSTASGADLAPVPEFGANITQPEAFIIQSGKSNLALIDQTNSTISYAEIQQTGQTDSANILDTGSHNQSRIIQTGNNDIAVIQTAGSNNMADISQLHNQSAAYIVQSGSNNTATIRQ